MNSKPVKQAVKQVIPEPPDLDLPDGFVEINADVIVDRSTHEGVKITNTSAPVKAKSVAIEQAIISGNALAGSVLAGAEFRDCLFDHSDLASVTWVDARLVRCKFVECRLTGADLRLGELSNVNFENCKMPEALVSESKVIQVRFDHCQLNNLDLSGATIESLAMQHSDLANLRLDGARINHLDLRGSTIDGIMLDPQALKGLIIDPLQSPAVVQSLGVRVLGVHE